MESSFLSRLAAEHALSDSEHAVLSAAGVRSAADLHSLATSFPSLHARTPRLAHLVRAVEPALSDGYCGVCNKSFRTRRPKHGVMAPKGVPFPVGAAVPHPSLAAASETPGGEAPPSAAAPSPAIDLRLPGWKVHDQGDRQTCVAFSTAACVEHLNAVAGAPLPDYAPQFLYWAIKTAGPDEHKDKDGATLALAVEALPRAGICTAALWPYAPAMPNPVSGQTATDPSPPACADALTRRHAVTTFETKPANAAARVRALLARGRPVAVSLAIFRDPTLPNGDDNWGTPVGWAYGRVLNPPSGAVSVGGHCVCVVGWTPDPAEPLGGHFILRNTWGTDWAQHAYAAGMSEAPEPGYGEISASYVEACCWELMQL